MTKGQGRRLQEELQATKAQADALVAEVAKLKAENETLRLQVSHLSEELVFYTNQRLADEAEAAERSSRRYRSVLRDLLAP